MIFISYRRNDEPGYVGRVADGLRNRFGSESVFLDIDDMSAGKNWQTQINTKIENCSVLVAIIGRNWGAELQARSESQKPGEDIHSFELSTAQAMGKPVMSVTLRDANLPDKHILGELEWLLGSHIFNIRDGQNQWEQDIDKLAAAIESISGLRQCRQPSLQRYLPVAAIAFTMLLIVGTAILLNRPDGKSDVTANAGFASNFPIPLGQLTHDWEDVGDMSILLDAPVGSENERILNNFKFPAGSGKQGILLEQFCTSNRACIRCTGSPSGEELRHASLVTVAYIGMKSPLEEEMKTADQSNIWPIKDNFKPWENIDRNTGKRTIYSCNGD